MAQALIDEPARPDLGSFLLLVVVVVLLACTIYLIYLGCTSFGAGPFFRAIYSPQRVPEMAAWAFPNVAGLG